MVDGSYELLLDDHEQIYAYTRTLQEDQLLVICNFSAERPLFTLPEGLNCTRAELLISNYEADGEEDFRSFRLKPYEARVYRLK
ncbi:alpha-glucosidase C-terminal domain-containing protein [Paenibacillus macerans]|uniref:alpha-glucosidase C-terminal domain-containing protein n=1 Tax=Paenibacillus macerans TaxID=44252 RepID=UPI0037C64D36